MNPVTDFIPLLDRYCAACTALGSEPVKWAGWQDRSGKHDRFSAWSRCVTITDNKGRRYHEVIPESPQPQDLAAARDMMAEVVFQGQMRIGLSPFGASLYFWRQGVEFHDNHLTRTAALLAGFTLAVEELEASND